MRHWEQNVSDVQMKQAIFWQYLITHCETSSIYRDIISPGEIKKEKFILIRRNNNVRVIYTAFNEF